MDAGFTKKPCTPTARGVLKIELLIVVEYNINGIAFLLSFRLRISSALIQAHIP
jgi:hypothetical protein